MTRLVLAAFAILIASSGCVRVKAYDRAILSSRVMRIDPDPAERRLDAHVYENREASMGGSGVGAGGCGCN